MAAPTIYLIAGCNGAGKTTFAKEFLPSIGVIRFLNADEIARGLSPLKPAVVAFKAGRLLLSELRELIDRRGTFALESTLSGRTYVSLFEKAKDRGYRIELHFVWLPNPQEAIRRVRQRVKEGGHHVPADDIRRRFARSIAHLLNDYAPLADKWFLWDNSAPPAKLLAESASQTIVQLRAFSHSMKKLHNGLRPIAEKDMSPEARIASRAHRRATRKKRVELRQRALPMIIWKDGAVSEVPA